MIGVLLGSRGGVSCLEFAGKYPLLISCTQLGVVSVFTIRGSPHELKNTCIGRFVNLNSDHDGFYLGHAIKVKTIEVLAIEVMATIEVKAIKVMDIEVMAVKVTAIKLKTIEVTAIMVTLLKSWPLRSQPLRS